MTQDNDALARLDVRRAIGDIGPVGILRELVELGHEEAVISMAAALDRRRPRCTGDPVSCWCDRCQRIAAAWEESP